jgi:hypothetical protein
VVCYNELRLAGIVTPVIRSQPSFSAFPPVARRYSNVTDMLRGVVQAGVRVKVTVTSADVTVTSTVSSKIRWQAGMSKRKNSLAGYIPGAGRDNWDFREILAATGFRRMVLQLLELFPVSALSVNPPFRFLLTRLWGPQSRFSGLLISLANL